MPPGDDGHSTTSRKPDGRHKLLLRPGQELSGVRVIAATGERRHRQVVWRVECLRCGKELRRTTGSLTARPDGLGCRACARVRSAGGDERRARVLARLRAGERVEAVARAEGLGRTRVGQFLGEVLRAELAALPPADLLAGVMALSPIARRRVLLAAWRRTAGRTT